MDAEAGPRQRLLKIEDTGFLLPHRRGARRAGGDQQIMELEKSGGDGEGRDEINRLRRVPIRADCEIAALDGVAGRSCAYVDRTVRGKGYPFRKA